MSNGRCWICSGPSETGEHRIKKSDLVSRFGRGPFLGDDSLVHVKEEQVRAIQGPDSKLVKYEKNLCAHCNNDLTQPFDLAYDKFIGWINTNEQDVLKRRVVDFECAFGTEWETEQRNLFKFFAKSFGCAVDALGRSVPVDVVHLLGQDAFETALYVTFQINEDQLLLQPKDQAIGTMGLRGDLQDNGAESPRYQWGSFYRWLTIGCWYNVFSNQPIGAPWVANSKHVYLGWYQPLTAAQRAQLLAALKD